MAIVMLLTVLPLAGCFSSTQPQPPTDQELVKEVEGLTHGERIQYNGNGEFISLDRDLSFTATFQMQQDSMNGVPVPSGYKSYSYRLSALPGRDDYAAAVMKYWDFEVEKLIEKYGFSDYGFSEDTPDNENGRYFNIFIDEDGFEEAIPDVDNFILDLKQISQKEEQFHTSPYNMKILVNIYYAVPGTDKCVYPRLCHQEIVHTMNDDKCRVENWDTSYFERKFEDDITTQCRPCYSYVRIRKSTTPKETGSEEPASEDIVLEKPDADAIE